MMMCSNLNFLNFPLFFQSWTTKERRVSLSANAFFRSKKIEHKILSLLLSLSGSLTRSHSDRTPPVVSDVNDDNDRKNAHNTETFFSFRERMRGSSSLSNFAARIEASDESLFSLRSKKCTSKGSTWKLGFKVSEEFFAAVFSLLLLSLNNHPRKKSFASSLFNAHSSLSLAHITTTQTHTQHALLL